MSIVVRGVAKRGKTGDNFDGSGFGGRAGFRLLVGDSGVGVLLRGGLIGMGEEGSLVLVPTGGEGTRA